MTMLSKWCVIVLVLWTTMVLGLQTKDSNLRTKHGSGELSSGTSGLRSGTSGSSSSVLSLSDRVKQVKVNARRIRRETNGLMLKVRLYNGSYLYRKVSSSKGAKAAKASKASKASKAATAAQSAPAAVTRVARGYSNNKKGKGYDYPKGYNYKPPTTRLPPLSESTAESDSESLTPSPPDPSLSNPEKGFETTTPNTLDPWDIRDSVPGEPGKDYNALSKIPETSFTCEGRTPGFYADTEAGCQVFHRCTDDPWYTGQVRVTMDSFLCPNGSLFNQQIYTCDWWGNVECETAPEFYQLNEQIGQLEETEAGTIQYVQFGGVRVPPPPGHKRKAPRIVPKSERKQLPDKYRTKHGHNDHSDPAPNGSGQPLSTDNDDPEGLANDFNRESSEEDRDGQSQNLDEVSARPPKSKKNKNVSRKKSSKKSKTTTTTTTTPEPETEEEEDDESNETEEDEDENDEEEPAATNDGAQGLIVNRPTEAGEKAESQEHTPPDILKPPTFTGEAVDSDKERSGDRDKGDGTYIPPTKEPNSGYSYPPPQSGNYLPPNEGKEYLPPNKQAPGYISGTSPPTATYLPPTPSPNQQDGYPNTPDSYYRKPSTGYGAPPTPVYSSPQQPNNAYLPPQNNNAYLPPQQQNNAYLPPQNSGYSAPQQNNAYLPPQQNNAYLPPQQNNGYLPPQQQNNPYLPPQPQQQNNAYLPPQQNSGYGPPQQNNAYLPPQQNNAYLPPQKPNNAYLPPQGQAQLQPANSTYLPPQSTYLPPQQSNQGYAAPTPQSNAYLPPQQNQGYSSNNQPNREYLPPNNQGYLPPSQPQGYQQPSREYLPANKEYLPPTPPSRKYLPVSQGYSPGPPPGYSPGGYSGPSRTTVEHWPARYDYEAPTSPASVHYSIPSPTQSSPQTYGVNSNYNSPVRYHSQNYQSPPSQNYGHVVKNFIPVAAPTTQTQIQYSTIPVQTPPPREGFSGGQPFVQKPNVRVELYNVPLVSSSHSQFTSRR